MKTFRRVILSAAACAALSVGSQAPAWATFEVGVEAYKTGEVQAAIDIWRKFALAGDVRAKKILGDLYSNAELEDIDNNEARVDQIAIDYPEAMMWYTLAAFHDFNEFVTPTADEVNAQILAQQRLADVRFLMTGTEVKSAEKKITDFYEGGSAFDLYRLGYLFQSGQGVAKDNGKARLFYKLAADRGGVAEASEAFEYLDKKLSRKETEFFEKEYVKWQPPLPAEHRGDTKQMEDLKTAQKKLEDTKLARALEAVVDIDVELLQNALNVLGFRAGEADNKIGPQTREAIRRFQASQKLEETGRLTAKQTVKLIEEAAKEDHALSQHAFGIMYAKGIGVKPNGDTALKWLNKAADQDLAISHFVLGTLYRDSTEGEKPVDVSLRKAAFHFAQSSTLGYRPAQAELEKLEF